jgi:hypothetical protein
MLFLPLFVCDALLRASWKALLATLTDSRRLFLISLLSLSLVVVIADVDCSDILKVPLSLNLLG